MKRNFKLLFLISIGLNVVLVLWVLTLNFSNNSLEISQGQKYLFLSKRIFIDDHNDILVNFTNLRSILREYIDDSPEKISLYFEYLPSGVSIGVNDKDEYKIASLVKVPIAMAVYKNIEKDRMTLEQELTLKKEDLDQQFGELWKKGEGGKVKVSEALEAMLSESDNTAVNLLFSNLSAGSLDDVFDSLDIPKQNQDYYPVVSTKNYSSILRSLYLSSYLSRDHSNQILANLTESIHDDRIRSGIPSEFKVANKIGIFKSVDSKEMLNSDCGIVYLPNRPFLICITVSANEVKAAKHISTISKQIYDYVDNINRD